MRNDVLENDGTGSDLRGGEIDPGRVIGRILVPVDFSACSLGALEHAVALARRFGASIHVLHVWPLPDTIGPSGALAHPDLRHETLAQFAQSQAGEAMETVLGDLEHQGIAGARGRLACGDPSETIIHIAREDRYDLIVMGTHGHTGLSHLIHGSVAEKVVRRAPCPVLTVRMAESAEDDRQPSERNAP